MAKESMKAREVKRAKLAKRYQHKRDEIAAKVKSGEMDHEEVFLFRQFPPIPQRLLIWNRGSASFCLRSLSSTVPENLLQQGRVLMMQMLPSWKKTKSCWQTAKKNFPKPDKSSKKGRNSMKTVKSNLKTVRNNSAAQKPCWREAGQPCPADRQS